ncbi:MAG TPA: PDR/VanB family oxidoreductase [Bacillales bacterium]
MITIKFEKSLAVTVQKIIQETPNIKRFFLSSKEKLPPFSAGSHITTYLDGHEGHYSLVSHLAENMYEIAVRRETQSNGTSTYWHDAIREGDQVKISYPRNHFALSFRAKHHVFFAAGIGITPFMAMMAELQARGSSFELHYAARSRAECAFHQLISRKYPAQSEFYFSQEEEKRRMTTKPLLNQPIGTHVYFCGPELMLSQFSEAALSYGYPKGSLHFERFTANKAPSPVPFQVELCKSKRELTVPKDCTLLDVLLKAGVKAPYSCKVGECGTCELEVLDGKVDHYDSFLSEEEKEEQGAILTCVSRACSEKLVLNI